MNYQNRLFCGVPIDFSTVHIRVCSKHLRRQQVAVVNLVRGPRLGNYTSLTKLSRDLMIRARAVQQGLLFRAKRGKGQEFEGSGSRLFPVNDAFEGLDLTSVSSFER